jgi:hypothetical protein
MQCSGGSDEQWGGRDPVLYDVQEEKESIKMTLQTKDWQEAAVGRPEV